MSKKWLLVVPVGALMAFSLANAQDQGGPGRRGDPAQWRQRMLDNMKEELNASDDEWKVLEPKIEKVQTVRMESFAGFGGRGGRGMGGRRGGADRNNNANRNTDRPESKVAQAQRELRDTLDNKSASSEEITKKLAALRDARSKARASLEAAQKDLKEVCTPRQEAVLVVNGMLE